METVRCAQCGLLNFASSGVCKRCRRPLDEMPAVEEPFFEERGSSQGGGRSGGRALRRLVVLALLAAVGFAAYTYRHRVWYGAGAEYALAIRDAEQFKEPLTVKARKRVSTAQGVGRVFNGPGQADPVYVLKARGLVEFGAARTEERVVGSVTSTGLFNGANGESPTSTVEVKQQFSNAGAALTPSGKQVADGWEDSGDGAWLVPIGTREVYRVEKVGEVETASGVETRDVEFSWRWLPNSVGEAFDTDGKFFSALKDDEVDNQVVRLSVLKYNWGSAKVYRAVAHFERQAGGDWHVAGIEKSDNVDSKKGLSAF